jgi:23S rRNA pseudouridine2605 synthase
MRINKYLAQATGMSRRASDKAISAGKVRINDQVANLGETITDKDIITYEGRVIVMEEKHQTIMLNKPIGYVCSRQGQGNATVYDLLPENLHHLKPIGRLDKDSSGLLLFTNDGDLSQRLTHPKYRKIKLYDIRLNKTLQPLHRQMIIEYGVELEDGLSKLALERIEEYDDHNWRVTMAEGRNRQIRRTFSGLGYNVDFLHRIGFGPYRLPEDLKPGTFVRV